MLTLLIFNSNHKSSVLLLPKPNQQPSTTATTDFALLTFPAHHTWQNQFIVYQHNLYDMVLYTDQMLQTDTWHIWMLCHMYFLSESMAPI